MPPPLPLPPGAGGGGGEVQGWAVHRRRGPRDEDGGGRGLREVRVQVLHLLERLVPHGGERGASMYDERFMLHSFWFSHRA